MRTLLLVAALLLHEEEARACSCSEPSIARRTIPKDGTSSFPIDGQIFIFITGGLPKEVRAELAQEYRLRDEAGRLIDFTSNVQGTLLTLRPKASLRPRTRYTIERVFSYSDAGEKLSDSQRWKIVIWGDEKYGPKEKIASRRWFPESSFTTGEGKETSAPVPPSIEEAKIHFAYGGGDCGPGSYVSIEYRLGLARETDVFGVEIEGTDVLWLFAHADSPQFRTGFGNQGCVSDSVAVEPSEKYRARMFALSASGQRAVGKEWTPVRPRQPYRQDLAERFGKRMSESGLGAGDAETIAGERQDAEARMRAVMHRFFSPPIDEKPIATRPVGPSGCPHGLVSAGVIELPDGVVPWTSGSSSSLGWQRGRAYTVFEDDKRRTTQMIEFDLTGRSSVIELPAPADETVAVFASDFFVIASTVFEGNSSSKIRVSLHSYDGKARWKRTLGGESLQWHPRLALHGDRIMVAWSTIPLADRTYPLHWTLLATADGTEKVAKTERTVPGDSDGNVALGHDGRSFLMAWSVGWSPNGSRNPPSRWARIGPGGELIDPKDIPGGAFRGVDFSGATLVYASSEGVQLRTIASAELSRPIRLDVGLGGPGLQPRVVARGNTFFVVWRSNDAGHITAVDAAGRVAPPTALGGGVDVTIPALVATNDGLLAVYGAGSVNIGTVPRAERFVCRKESTGGAPSKIR